MRIAETKTAVGQCRVRDIGDVVIVGRIDARHREAENFGHEHEVIGLKDERRAGRFRMKLGRSIVASPGGQDLLCWDCHQPQDLT